ncbi:MAG: hypothetical protein A2901_00885 [Elusimicrobia bacterium RIFCSPLOWO2_01_FULL_54_10]|nr:MAG: hypothetical protein A2901_00885 [Elusimicrobia bacterium RIFCSPLOWO2_01_FULL_54_10]
MEKMKILIIDDEGPIADMIADFCQAYGFDARVLNGGQDALEVAKDYRPDLITVDLMMPGTSGPEVVDILKADPQTSTIPFIIISSYGWTPDIAQTFKMAKGVVQKPITMKDLSHQIEKALAS